jgi:hypothetical protein
MPQSELKPHQSSLILAGLASLILWVVPVFGFILLPLQYLNTHLHEFSHALIAALTGGPVDHIQVFANGSGVTLAGGSPILVSSAGYIGATILGGLMIRFGGTERGAAIVLRATGAILAFSLLFWVRGDLVGVLSGILWTLALFAAPHFMQGRPLVFTAQLVGMQQCLASVQALYILYNISAYGGQSDAANMASYTGVPAIFWALLWGVIGLGAVLMTLRSSWNPKS